MQTAREQAIEAYREKEAAKKALEEELLEDHKAKAVALFEKMFSRAPELVDNGLIVHHGDLRLQYTRYRPSRFGIGQQCPECGVWMFVNLASYLADIGEALSSGPAACPADCVVRKAEAKPEAPTTAECLLEAVKGAVREVLDGGGCYG